MGFKQEKRTTMPAKVTYGFFIHIIHVMDKLLKCSDRAVAYGTWCMSEWPTTQRAAFLAGCLMNRFVQVSGAPIVQ